MIATPQLNSFSFPSFTPIDEPDEPIGSISLTFLQPELPTASKTTQPNDDELTSLNWLQKPGVLNSMCNALTGSPHRLSAMGTRSSRKPRAQGKIGEKTGKDGDPGQKKTTCNSAEKMLNVVLSVRNKRYDGEDTHKPPLSFACMIFMALESSPTKTLPVKQIYEWIQWKFPYYNTAPPGWKNSIRHNLSLNKCFRKVEKLSRKSRSVVTKGGLWTVDSAYRNSIISALKMNPYHPYHKYFMPPYFPRSMIAALRDELELVVSDKGLDPDERDAALSICLISGAENGGVDPLVIRAIYNDHCYTQLPTPPPSPIPEQRSLPNLDEVLAAAEVILGGVEEIDDETCSQKAKCKRKTAKPKVGRKRSKQKRRNQKQPLRRSKRRKVEKGKDQDEVYHSDFHRDTDGEEEEEEEERDRNTTCNGGCDDDTDNDCSLADSGYSGTGSSPLSHESRSSSLDDIRGANALLCLANTGHPSYTAATDIEVPPTQS